VHITLLCVGRIRTRATRDLIDDFLQRLRAYHTIEEIETRAAAGDLPERAIVADSENVLSRIDRSDRVWLLDREGRQWSSEELARNFAAEERQGKGRMTLVIGGAYGFDERVQKRADVRWSLSSLTFLHEWARAITTEQLYRATKILRNEPYHH
jgi:23S rRNA (pseudouridine1915-N3)-methyltransferase